MVRKEHLYIFLDSNILIQNKGFNSSSMQHLLDYARQTKSNILLHDIVLREVNAYIVRTFNEQLDDIEKSLNKLKCWSPDYTIYLEKEKLMKSALDTFGKCVSNSHSVILTEKPSKTFIRNDIIIRIPLDNSDCDEAVNRLIERIPPCSKKGEEFRDTMIWLNTLSFCKSYGMRFCNYDKKVDNFKVAFICENWKDFAQEEGPTKKRILKKELLDDIKNYGIDLVYFDSLSNFLKEYSEPIGIFNRNWIEQHIDFEKIKELIQKSGVLRDFNFYDRFDKYIEHDEKIWNIKLGDFYIWKSEIGLEVNLSFAVVISENLHVEHEKEIVSSMKIEFAARIADDGIIFSDTKPMSIHWQQTS